MALSRPCLAAQIPHHMNQETHFRLDIGQRTYRRITSMQLIKEDVMSIIIQMEVAETPIFITVMVALQSCIKMSNGQRKELYKTNHILKKLPQILEWKPKMSSTDQMARVEIIILGKFNFNFFIIL